MPDPPPKALPEPAPLLAPAAPKLPPALAPLELLRAPAAALLPPPLVIPPPAPLVSSGSPIVELSTAVAHAQAGNTAKINHAEREASANDRMILECGRNRSAMKTPNAHSYPRTMYESVRSIREMKPLSHSLVVLTLATGCGGALKPAPAALPAAAISAPTQPSASAPAAPPGGNPIFALPQAQSAFEAEGVTGAMALFDTRNGKLSCSDEARCNRGYIPASTFKIVNSIIGLETGVLSDAESPLPWDGKQYTNPDWNRDHTLRTAIQVSCVPCFQRIARQIGEAQMKDWVNRLDYGNRDIGGPIDFFWLGGALRVTPFQQIDFLRRLDGEKLPIQARTLDTVRDILTLDVGPSHVLRGKTGLAGPPEQPSEVGWFVGFVELAEARVFFATVLDGHGPDVDIKPVRRRVTERVLRELDALPD
jgi:beta-lactamase class D